MKYRIIFILVLLLAAFLYCSNTLFWKKAAVDDAFISYRYSRNLARGEGLSYNRGSRVEGFSNFLWVLLHAIPIRRGMDPVYFSRFLSLVSGIFLLAVVLNSLRNGEGRITLIGAASAVYLALNPFLGLWTMAGLETVFYAALLTGGVYLLSGEMNHKRYIWSAVLLALACLTRPEATFVVAAVFGYQLLGVFLRKKVLKPQLWWGSVLLFIVGVYYVWRLSYFGDFFPNTYYAKLGEEMEGWNRRAGLAYLVDFIRTSGWPLLVYLAVGAALIFKFDRRGALAWILPASAGIFFAYYSDGDWMPNFRFLVPVLPLLLIAASSGFVRLGTAPGYRPGGKFSFSPAVAMVGVGFLGWSLVHVYPLKAVWVSELSRGFTGKSQLLPPLRKCRRVGYDIWTPGVYSALRHARPGETISLGDIGVVGYVMDCDILDTNGLVDKMIARLNRDENFGEAIAGYFLDREPEVVFLLTASGENSLEAVGRSSAAILGSEAFRRRWREVGRTRAIEDTTYTIFRRTDTSPPSPEEVEENFKIAARRLPGAPWFRLTWATEITNDNGAAIEECLLLRKDFPENQSVMERTSQFLAEKGVPDNEQSKRNFFSLPDDLGSPHFLN